MPRASATCSTSQSDRAIPGSARGTQLRAVSCTFAGEVKSAASRSNPAMHSRKRSMLAGFDGGTAVPGRLFFLACIVRPASSRVLRTGPA